MAKHLRALIVEDNIADIEILLHELQKAGFDTTWRRAGTEEEFMAELNSSWDIAFLDYHLPQFDTMRAIRLFCEEDVNVPVVVITGQIGDEGAAECIKQGAMDYLLKDRLARLGAAVHSALARKELEAQRRQADQRLRESEAGLRALTEALPQIVWTARPNGTLDYFNERWCEYSGLSAEQSANSGWQMAVHSDDLPSLVSCWASHVGRGDPFETEFRILRAGDTQYRWHLTRALAVSNGQGGVSKWYGTMTDIHDRKLAEQALERSNQALRAFAYAAGHDLQEPLRNVATSSTLLQRKYQGKLDSDAEWLLATNVEGAQRMHYMVKDLLAYTKVIEDHSSEAPLCEVEKALAQAAANLGQTVRETNAEITHGFLPRIRIREVHLVQLFQNLLSNSLKYRQPGRRPVIHIDAEQRGSDWIFAVRDNGIGFDPIYSNRIFGLFKRLHVRDEYAGNGMGLAICLRIVEHYAGRIWASAEIGRGATFFFELSADGSGR